MPSPLTKYQRQPKQSIDLPSKGRWYSQGSLEKSEELEVFSMTASNEIATKTPDTLLSGTTTVDIIKSCIPSIRNPWEIPMTDIYTILAAIRMASYGSSINAKNTCTECSEENNYDIDIQNMLAHFAKGNFEDSVVIDNMKFSLRPLTFKELNEINKQNFKLQRTLLQVVPSITDENQRAEEQQKVYDALAVLRKNTVISSIAKIEVDNEEETDLNEIAKFIENADKDFFVKVEQAIMRNNEQFIVPDTDIECANCGHKSKLNIEMDYSNFFAQG
tara:strand:+ start:182 stop:1006 length:825 start_codon:yes stop_codon:yes gene_type:complete